MQSAPGGTRGCRCQQVPSAAGLRPSAIERTPRELNSSNASHATCAVLNRSREVTEDVLQEWAADFVARTAVTPACDAIAQIGAKTPFVFDMQAFWQEGREGNIQSKFIGLRHDAIKADRTCTKELRVGRPAIDSEVPVSDRNIPAGPLARPVNPAVRRPALVCWVNRQFLLFSVLPAPASRGDSQQSWPAKALGSCSHARP